MTLGERIDTKQNLCGIRFGNPNGTIDRADRHVGTLNIESIAKNDQLNDQVASCAIKWKAGTVEQAPDLTLFTSTSLLTLAAKIFVDLPVHTSCTRRPPQPKTPLTPDASIDTHFLQAINTILQR